MTSSPYFCLPILTSYEASVQADRIQVEESVGSNLLIQGL